MEGVVILPNFDTWLEKILQGGTVMDAKEEEDHQLNEEGGAVGGLGQQINNGQEVNIDQTETRDRGVHEQVQEGVAGGLGVRVEGQEAKIGAVKEAVKGLEDEHIVKSSSSGQRKPRFVKPRMVRGVKKDRLIQARIDSLSSSGGVKLTGLIKVAGKRKFIGEVNNPTGDRKVARLEADGQLNPK